MFTLFKNSISSLYTQVSGKIQSLLGTKTIDESTIQELQQILIAADVGIPTAKLIIERLKKAAAQTTEEKSLKELLAPILIEILTIPYQNNDQEKTAYLLVGINGSGKTTLAGKLASRYKANGKKVLLVAADSFRAAATEQLNQWAERAGVAIITGQPNQDPASVVFQGGEHFKNNGYDILIIDTAGRLQTKVNLMHELSKIKRVISKVLPNTPIKTLLTIDAMLGQNSLEQASIFKEATDLDGIILTKTDGTGKGGIIFAIAHQLAIPIAGITFGEAADDYRSFDATAYVNQLLEI